MATTLHNFTLCCAPGNDLAVALSAHGYAVRISADLASALVRATRNAGIIVCADDFPAKGVDISAEMLEIAKEKNLRLIIEYPASVAGLKIGVPTQIEHERVIVTSHFFGPIPAKDSLLTPQGGYFLPVGNDEPRKVLLRLGKAAGYDSLAFGLPENTHPVLFSHPQYENVLISCCCISRFATARAAPKDFWLGVWRKILWWTAGTEGAEAAPIDFDWQPDVSPAYERNDSLPGTCEAGMTAFQRASSWLADNMVCAIDGDVMVLEGYQSRVDHNGAQRIRNVTRADCLAESSMIFATAAEYDRSPYISDLSASILDFTWSQRFFNGEPDKQCYGLVNWLDRRKKFYGDDNARVIMPSIAARGLLGDSRWDARILKCLLANLRTVNRYGFRLRSMWADEMEKKGWRHYRDVDDTIILSPHFQGYLWAAFLWAYRLTGYEPFLTKTKTGIRACMEAYPDRWNWTNSLTAEIARMLLPLAFLVRVDDTSEHRGWLLRICGDLIGQMTADGAIEDMIGAIANGTYPPPQSNETYATGESSLIQKNGDPATDLLYTVNWAFIGLHEAVISLSGDTYHRYTSRHYSLSVKESSDKLADFLCRIQVRSTRHANLDGAWMRSFDFERWEFYGSSADSGWGAWCIEAGWVNTWIPMTFALREMGKSLMDLYDGANFKEIAPGLIAEMMIE